MSWSFVKNNLLRLLILGLLIVGFFVTDITNNSDERYNDNYTENDINNIIQVIQESDISNAYKRYKIATIQEAYQISNTFDAKEKAIWMTKEVWINDYKDLALIWVNIEEWKIIKEQYIALSDSFKKNSNEFLMAIYWDENNFPTWPYSHSEYIKKQLKIYDEKKNQTDLYINFYNYILAIQKDISIEDWDVYINNEESLIKHDKMIDEIERQATLIESLEEDFSQYESTYKEKNSEYLF